MSISPFHRALLSLVFIATLLTGQAHQVLAQAGRQSAAQVPSGSAAAESAAAAQAYLRENYTKYEYKIRMRDGVRLFTAVYVPKDDEKPYPILLSRTPYTVKPYGEDVYPSPGGPMNHYAKERFIFAMQDVRGRNGSEGTFVHMRPILEKKPVRPTSTNRPMVSTRSIGS